jgi:hypothetical protein
VLEQLQHMLSRLNAAPVIIHARSPSQVQMQPWKSFLAQQLYATYPQSICHPERMCCGGRMCAAVRWGVRRKTRTSWGDSYYIEDSLARESAVGWVGGWVGARGVDGTCLKTHLPVRHH